MSSDIFEKLKQIWKCLYLLAEELSGNVGGFFAHFSLVTDLYTFVARWIFPSWSLPYF